MCYPFSIRALSWSPFDGDQIKVMNIINRVKITPFQPDIPVRSDLSPVAWSGSKSWIKS